MCMWSDQCLRYQNPFTLVGLPIKVLPCAIFGPTCHPFGLTIFSMLLAEMRVSYTLESSVAENLEICENSEMRDFESWRVVMGISLLMCSQLILFQYHVLRT